MLTCHALVLAPITPSEGYFIFSGNIRPLFAQTVNLITEIIVNLCKYFLYFFFFFFHLYLRARQRAFDIGGGEGFADFVSDTAGGIGVVDLF